MINYMESANPNYTKTDVDECQRILNIFLNKAAAVPDKATFLNTVENSVNKLNALNKKCSYDLIETIERETICEIMIRAGEVRRFNTMDEDITEDYREW